MFRRQFVRLLRAPSQEDLRLCRAGGAEGSIQPAFFNREEFTVEVYRDGPVPEVAADGQELVHPRVPAVVILMIAVETLLFGRMTGDHVQADAAVRQHRKRVDLLNKQGWGHQSRSMRDHHLQFQLRGLRASTKPRTIGSGLP